MAVVVLRVGRPVSSGPSAAAGRTVELIYRAQPTAGAPLTGAAVKRTAAIMRARISELGTSGASVWPLGSTEIAVRLPAVNNLAGIEVALTSSGPIDFYDWEANALTPSGRTVASQLSARTPSALEISRGGNAGPGADSRLAGAMGFYAAVKLASRQPSAPSARNSWSGSQYYLFGSPGSHACAAYAKARSAVPVKGRHCLIASAQVPDGTPREVAIRQLELGLDRKERVGAQTLVVKQGTAVLQATSHNSAHWPPYGSPDAGYYVFKDHVGVPGRDITNPQTGIGPASNPDVTLGFNGRGGADFQTLTRQVAVRATKLSTGSVPVYQHFAVVMDNRLLSVPYISQQAFPFGIPPGNGTSISGNFTRATATQLAAQLRLGALPVRLRLISAGE